MRNKRILLIGWRVAAGTSTTLISTETFALAMIILATSQWKSLKAAASAPLKPGSPLKQRPQIRKKLEILRSGGLGSFTTWKSLKAAAPDPSNPCNP